MKSIRRTANTERRFLARSCFVAVIAMGLSACGNPETPGVIEGEQNQSTTATMTDGQFVGCQPDLISPSSINWSDPPTDGSVVSTTAEAAANLAFVPREPQGLGAPDFIWVSGGAEASRASKGLRFKYDVDPYGILHVTMWLDPISESERISSWQKQVAQVASGNPCYRGHSELITIKGSRTALIGGPANEPRVSVNWREGPVWIQVSGPTLDRTDAISIAEKL